MGKTHGYYLIAFQAGYCYSIDESEISYTAFDFAQAPCYIQNPLVETQGLRLSFKDIVNFIMWKKGSVRAKDISGHFYRGKLFFCPYRGEQAGNLIACDGNATTLALLTFGLAVIFFVC